MARPSELQTHFERIAASSPGQQELQLAELKLQDPDLSDRIRRILESDSDNSPLDHVVRISAALTSDALDAPLPLGIPESIGDYRIKRCISSSGMSIVCEAKDKASGRRLAIKLLRDAGQSAASRQRFQREIDALKRVDHEGVVEILDHGLLGSGEPYIVMPLINGETLDRNEIARTGSLEAKLDLVRRVAIAVHHVHLKGVVHRDIKPSNIMVSADGAATLIDLGIAVLDPGPDQIASRVTQTGHAPGTPDYMSPEQFRGEDLDSRSDVYALGVLAYWLIAGAVPLQLAGLCPSAAEHKILFEEPAPLSKLAPSVRGDLSLVIQRALSKAPDDRYSSADEFAAEITRVLVGDPVSVSPISPARRIARWTRRHRSLARALALLCVGAVALSGLGLSIDRERQASARAERMSAALSKNGAFLPDLATLSSKQHLGPQTPFLTLLEAFAANLDETDMSLESRANAHKNISNAYSTLEALKLALPHAELSADLHTQLYGERDASALLQLIDYARILQLTGDLDRSEQVTLLAHDRFPSSLRRTHPDIAAYLLSRTAKIHLERGRPAQAERLLLEARGLWQTAYGENNRFCAGCDLWLGRVYRSTGRHDQALRVLEQGLKINTQVKHSMHPRSVMIRIEMARVHADRLEPALARQSLREELDRCESAQNIGPDDQLTEEIRELLASLD